MSIVSKWLIVAVVSVVVIGTSSVLLAHALMPSTPSPKFWITGTSVVRDGDVLHVHGQGFQPGDGIALTIDNGLPVSFAGQHGGQALAQRSERNVQVAGMSQMNIAGALQPLASENGRVTVSSSGTFDAFVPVPNGLPTGQHALHAKDNQSSRSASLQFTVTSSQLVVNPTALNFGSVEVGRTVKLLVTVSNLGGASLHWTATVEGSQTSWLTLSKNGDVLGTNGANETVIVTANTTGLAAGTRYATLHFHSDNGDVLIIANIHVGSVGQSGQQPILNVSQQSLDFGQLQAGQPGQKSIAIANLGNLPLQWQASVDTASANWLSLSTSKGTVQPGAVPQTVQVNVDTSGLAAGSYSGTVNVTSNGGNAQVKVTLLVKNTPRLPTVTAINPASGQDTGGTTVTIRGTGFTGATNVTFGQAPASNITVVSDTQITATSPAGSGSVDVTVTTPVGASVISTADQFTYNAAPPPLPTVTAVSPSSGSSTGGTPVKITGTGFIGATNVLFGKTPASNVSVVSDTEITAKSPAGSGTVDVIVNTAGGASTVNSSDQFTYTSVAPAWSVNPTSLDGSTCGQTAPCQVTLTEDVNSTVSIKWSASSNIGATFKPQSGTLSPTAQQNSISISISAPCQSDTFTFKGSGGASPLTVTWTCSSSSPTASPSTTTGTSWSGIFTYYNPNNGSQFNATLTLPVLPQEGQNGSPIGINLRKERVEKTTPEVLDF